MNQISVRVAVGRDVPAHAAFNLVETDCIKGSNREALREGVELDHERSTLTRHRDAFVDWWEYSAPTR